MINQYDAFGYMADQLPQIKNDLRLRGNEGDIYRSMQVLTDYTKRMALSHDFKMVERCMTLVDKIYRKGTALVRNAVENVFIFSFSSMMSTCNPVEWRLVQSYMPSELYLIYVKQVTCHSA